MKRLSFLYLFLVVDVHSIIASVSFYNKLQHNMYYVIATIPTTVSTADKLKELASMKEASLISEDEYANKREELLAKM